MITKVQAMQEKIKGILTPEQLKQLNDSGFNCNPGMGGQRKRGGGFMGGGF